MRTLLLFAIAAFTAFAQPSAFTRLDLYPSGASTGLLRFFEVRSNGSNYAGIRGRSAMASDCEFVISNLSFEPCGDGLQTLGDPAKRWSHVYSAAATLSGSGSVLQITGSTSGSALNISGGGGATATSFYSLTRMLANGDGYYVTPDGIAQNQVIDRFRNATVANLTVSGTCSGCGSGITSINGLTAASQTLATGTTGTDFNISPSGSTNTFNLPNAGAAARGVVSTGTQTFAGAKTFTSDMTTESILPSSNATKDIGSVGTTYSNMYSVIYNARVSTGTFASMAANPIFGGSVFVTNTSGTTQATMDTNGVNVTSFGTYRVGGTVVINASRVLQNISNVGTNLIPSIGGTYDIGVSGTSYRNGSINNLYSDAVVPNATGTGNVGTSGLVWGNGYFTNMYVGTLFRYGTSTTSGNVFTADASGFGTWQPLPVASSSVAGVVSTSTQTFAGAKTFSSSATFSNGLSTNSGTDSTIFVGNGNFYIRSFSGAPNCSGVTNGWIGLDTSGGTSGRLYVCNGGNARYVDLN